MFSNVKNMFKIPDLRGKILFTLAIIALYRFGAHIPTPGVDFEAVEALPMSTEQVSSPVIVGRIGPATVETANSSSSVQPLRRR